MIGLVGHTDLTEGTWDLLEAELPATLAALAPAGAPALVRVGAGLPLALGRAAHRAGRALVVLLPAEGALPVPLSESDRAAAGELLLLADQARLLPFAPADRDACVRADEELVRSCQAVVAVWDGSPSNGRDATAHLVAFARGRGIPVKVVWPTGAARCDAGAVPGSARAGAGLTPSADRGA